jgi:hypothetical protein
VTFFSDSHPTRSRRTPLQSVQQTGYHNLKTLLPEILLPCARRECSRNFKQKQKMINPRLFERQAS